MDGWQVLSRLREVVLPRLNGKVMAVLVVEDNPADMKLATFLLESAGHTVITAADAEAGLAPPGAGIPTSCSWISSSLDWTDPGSLPFSRPTRPRERYR